MFTKLRNKVKCYCKECNGKYVEERTRKSHIELERRLASRISRFVPFFPQNNRDKPTHTILEVSHSPITEGSSGSKEKVEQEPFDNGYEPDLTFFVPQKRRRQDQFREPEVNQHDNSSNRPIGENEYEDDMFSENDDMVLSDDEILVEQFAAPETDSEFAYPDTNVNFANSWILI